ncbi:glycosyltransferase [Candidatus Saccharibacteria bacterium]|nr:glycosyltransferase [Candidatus Saccharibacteria bacterium]
MKIAIATAVYYPQINGVAVFSHNLAVGLAGRGHEVMVICPSQTGKSYEKIVDGVRTVYLKSVDMKVYPDQIHSVPEKRRFLGLKLPHLWYKNGFKVSVFPNQEIKAALSSFEPDVVHVQVSDPIGLSVVSYAKKNNIPVVTTEHNQPEVLTDPLHMPRIMKRPTNYLLSAYFRNRQSKSDFVTMPTEQAIRGLLKGNKDLGVPIAAVSNGVDLSRFKPGKTSDVIYKKYSIPTDKLTVLYVGRVDPEKKVGTVIEAFLKAEVDNSQMVIVGDGVDKAKLENKFGKLDDIHFLGRVAGDDLYELYKIGDVFATASEIETQGIVLIEAAACGLPVIAVDKGAVSEVCLDEENGYLCEPGSVPEIAAAIKKILSDEKLRERFAKKSLEIAKGHDFETTLDKFINIYNKVVER